MLAMTTIYCPDCVTDHDPAECAWRPADVEWFGHLIPEGTPLYSLVVHGTAS